MDQALSCGYATSEPAFGMSSGDGGQTGSVLAPERCASVLGARIARKGHEGEVPVGIAFDSRRARAGEMFVALAGEQVDGHKFVPAAHKAGCRAALVSDAERATDSFDGDVPDDLWLIETEDPRRALSTLARAHRAQMDGLVVGVTGSVGKTTTCTLLDAALGAGLDGKCPEGSFNNDIGVPVTLLGADAGVDYLICEIGMSTPGEIRAMGEVAGPGACVITGAGRAHLEGLGSVEAIAQEKASLAACVDAQSKGDGRIYACAESGALVNALQSLLERGEIDASRVVWYARRDRAQGVDDARWVEDVRTDSEGVSFSLGGKRFAVPIIGEHHALNAAAAVLVARGAGLDDEVIARGLSSARPPAMRMQRSESRGVVFINDAYNANPDSVNAAINWFASAELPGKVLVLGDMLELGGAAADLHAETISTLAKLASGWRIELVGPMMCGAGRHLEGARCHSEANDVAMREIAAGLSVGETVLLKGSRGMRLERVIGEWERLGG